MAGGPQRSFDPLYPQGGPSRAMPERPPANPSVNPCLATEPIRRQSYKSKDNGWNGSLYPSHAHPRTHDMPADTRRTENTYVAEPRARRASPTWSNSLGEAQARLLNKPFMGKPIERGPAATHTQRVQDPSAHAGPSRRRSRSPPVSNNNKAPLNANGASTNGWDLNRIYNKQGGPSGTNAIEDHHAAHRTSMGGDSPRSRRSSSMVASTSMQHADTRPNQAMPSGAYAQQLATATMAQVAAAITPADSLHASDYMYEMITATTARQNAIRAIKSLEALLERCRGRPNIDVVARDIEEKIAVQRAAVVAQEERMRAAHVMHETCAAQARRQQVEEIVRSMVAESVKALMAANPPVTSAFAHLPPQPPAPAPIPAPVDPVPAAPQQAASQTPAATPALQDQQTDAGDGIVSHRPAKRRYVDIDSVANEYGPRLSEVEGRVEELWMDVDRLDALVPDDKTFNRLLKDVEKLKRAGHLPSRMSASVDPVNPAIQEDTQQG